MIISKTPFRISLGGGGTDLPKWYEKNGSMFISGAIDKYMYISLYRTPFFEGIHLKYSKNETVDRVEDIEHDIIRQTLKATSIENHLEIVSHADIPAGTGLGSSGSFGVGLVKAINPAMDKEELAKFATVVQMKDLRLPIGVQDQYAAAYGGVNVYSVDRGGVVSVEPLWAGYEAKMLTGILEDRLVLFYTGIERDANEILGGSSRNGMKNIQKLGHFSLDALEKGNFRRFGELMHDHWRYKKRRHDNMTNSKVDNWYNLAIENGALGGKLIGAGGGGFLMFYTEDRKKLIEAMPLKHLDFKFDMEGSKIL